MKKKGSKHLIILKTSQLTMETVAFKMTSHDLLNNSS